MGVEEGGVFQKGVSQEVDPERGVLMGESKHRGLKRAGPKQGGPSRWDLGGGCWEEEEDTFCFSRNGGGGCTACPLPGALPWESVPEGELCPCRSPGALPGSEGNLENQIQDVPAAAEHAAAPVPGHGAAAPGAPRAPALPPRSPQECSLPMERGWNSSVTRSLPKNREWELQPAPGWGILGSFGSGVSDADSLPSFWRQFRRDVLKAIPIGIIAIPPFANFLVIVLM